MAWLIVLVLTFCGLHFVLLFPAQVAIFGALICTAVLWVIWKLKWIVLGILGLEALFGGD